MMKGTPSRTAAVAYNVLGDTSGSSAAMAASRFSAVSFRFSATCNTAQKTALSLALMLAHCCS